MKYNSSAIKTAVQDVELVVVCLGTGLYIIFTSSLWYDVICLHLLVLTPSSIDKRTQDGSNHTIENDDLQQENVQRRNAYNY
jgi:hypothetical protein